jgi:hypothetical protein
LGELPRRIWSKLQLVYDRLPRPRSNAQLDIKLSTAAGISARFPFILPAASIDLTDRNSNAAEEKMRLVDGGYVESSAVETANEILQLLKGGYKIKGYDPIKGRDPKSETQDPDVAFKFYLIVLMGYEGIEDSEKGYGESAVPMRSLISTWSSRADQTFMRAFAQNCPFLNRCQDFLSTAREEAEAREEAKKDVVTKKKVVTLCRDFAPNHLNRCRLFAAPSTRSREEVQADVVAMCMDQMRASVGARREVEKDHQNTSYLNRCRVFASPPTEEREEVETDVAAIFLNLRDFNLPLTWQLTEASRRIISLHAGVPRNCRHDRNTMLLWTDRSVASGSADEAEYRGKRIAYALDENNCSACMLQYKLADRSVVPNNNRLCIRRPVATGKVGGN